MEVPQLELRPGTAAFECQRSQDEGTPGEISDALLQREDEGLCVRQRWEWQLWKWVRWRRLATHLCESLRGSSSDSVVWDLGQEGAPVANPLVRDPREARALVEVPELGTAAQEDGRS